MNKKIKTAVFAVMTACTVMLASACSNGQTAGQSASSSETAAIEGKTVEAGRITALCPNGWYSAKVYDINSREADTVRDDTVRFIKNGAKDKDFLNNAYIEIRYYASENDLPKTEPKKLYDNVENIDKMTIGESEWSGYSASSLGKNFIYLESKQDKAAFTAYLYLRDDTGNTASLGDADVQGILAGVKKGTGKTV